MTNYFDDASNQLEQARTHPILDSGDAGKVDKLFRAAQINALLAIAQALQSRS